MNDDDLSLGVDGVCTATTPAISARLYHRRRRRRRPVRHQNIFNNGLVYEPNSTSVGFGSRPTVARTVGLPKSTFIDVSSSSSLAVVVVVVRQ